MSYVYTVQSVVVLFCAATLLSFLAGPVLPLRRRSENPTPTALKTPRPPCKFTRKRTQGRVSWGAYTNRNGTPVTLWSPSRGRVEVNRSTFTGLGLKKIKEGEAVHLWDRQMIEVGKVGLCGVG